MTRRALSCLSAVLALCLVISSSAPALAATTPSSSATASNSAGLSIPPREDSVIQPGSTVNAKLLVSNLSENTNLDIGIKVVDFSFLNNTGTPKLDLNANAAPTSWSLKPYLKIPSSYVIPPGATASIPYSITIPENLGAGSYYSAVVYSSTGGNGQSVNLNASGVTLFFVSVPGIVKENMTLTKFGAYQPSADAALAGSYKYISTDSSPTQMAYSLQNNGNVAESPTGTIIIKPFFGGKTTIVSKININSDLSLIGQDRLFSACIKPVTKTLVFGGQPTPTNVCGATHFAPGYYRATIDVFYGQNGNVTQEVAGSAGFWYLPWWFIILIVVIILVLIIGIWLTIHKIRRRLYGKSSYSSDANNT